uniref:Helicase ATP-binding domain-containing protein n=1 Tax=Panagrolaimus sp. ES5 TaxID=591445 RepID=A0AC34F0Z6_9BILA
MYTHPKPLESIVLPLGFQGKNIFVQAKDGSGKTRCISALAANIVHETHSINIAVIIVAPNAENVYKIRDVFESLVSELPILAFGGEIDEDTKPLIGQWYPVIIAVPEMLSGLIRDEMISMESVSLVIISNADLFSDSVIQNDIQLLINSLMLSAIQLCIFSNGDAKNVYDFFEEYVTEPSWIQFGMEEHAETPQVKADSDKVVAENGDSVGGDATQDFENGPKKVEKKHVRFNDVVETKKITATEKTDEPCWIQFGMEEHAVTPQVTADCGKVVFENGAFVGGDATQGVENGPKIVEKKHVRFNDIVETKEITATEKSDGDSHNIELEKCAPDIAAEDLSPSNSSKVFDYAVIEIGRHPSSVIKDLLTNINFNQVVIFANDCEMCLSICETLAECTYKVGMISSNMALSEMDNITEEFAIQNLQVLVSKDVSICDESVSKNVNLVISVGLPEDELAYFGRINQIHGASLIIISNLLDYQSLVFDFCNSEMDVRSVRSDDIPDNLTVNKAFFDNSNKVNENYNNFILSYQAPATAPALVNRDAAVPAISLDTVPGVPTARTVHVPIVASPTVPAAAVAPTLPGPTKTIPVRFIPTSTTFY